MKRDVLPMVAPVDRGPLMGPDAVAEMIGGVTAAWVRKHVPNKIVLNRQNVRWYRADVESWLESRRRG